MVTMKQVKQDVMADSYSSKQGVFTLRRGFFYTRGRTPEQFKDEILEAYPAAIIIDCGEVWKPFAGGASVANSSHWFVQFTFDA